LPLEGMPSLGDSGGPALLENENGVFLVGITVGEVTVNGFSEETQGEYGSVAVYENVALQLDWIETVIGSSAPFDR
jgi:secreted trypsin-like serine protease